MIILYHKIWKCKVLFQFLCYFYCCFAPFSVHSLITIYNTAHNIIIIGAGNLGQAIANYGRFDRLGFKTIALFDISPDLIGQNVRGIQIYSLDDLEDFCKSHQVDIAALTMPKQVRIIPLSVWLNLVFVQFGILHM